MHCSSSYGIFRFSLHMTDNDKVTRPQSPEPVLRPRLLKRLSERFDARLTIIEAGAGFGKSTLLTHAIAENSLQPDGIDVLVRCHPAVSEPAALSAAILDALGKALGRQDKPRSVVDTVWSEAPTDVCIILDDLHRLQPATSGLEWIDQLLRDLPANGHMVIASRLPVGLSISRIVAANEIVRLSEDDLALTDDEVAEVLGPEVSAGAAAESARWPALAALMRTVGSSDSASFLWEEVLRPLRETERTDLATISLFEEVDRGLAEALGIQSELPELLSRVPLAPLDGETVRLHALWKPALAEVLSPAVRVDKLRAGAQYLHAAGRLLPAAQAYADAGDLEGLAAAADEATGHTLSVTQLADVFALASILPDEVKQSSLGRFTVAVGKMVHSLDGSIEDLESVAAAAEAEGDLDLTVRSLWRSTQIHGLLHGFPGAPHLAGWVERLAESGGPLAHAVFARHRAVSALVDGRPADALAIAAQGFVGFESDAAMLYSNLAMDSLNPDAVLEGSPLLNVADLPDESDLSSNGVVDFFGAQAFWYGGHMPATEAAPTAMSLVRMVRNQYMRHQDLMMDSTVSAVLYAGGHEREADELVEHAGELADEFAGTHMEVCALVAKAAQLSFRGQPDESEGQLLAALEVAPIRKWPHRPFTPAIAALAAMTSSPLDQVPIQELGEPFQVAVQAGRALQRWRKGEAGLAAALPWDRPNLLHAQVWPEHLTELAVAALSAQPAADAHRVRAVLAAIPGVAARLLRIAESHLDVGDEVRELATKLSDEPTPLLEVQTLGRFGISIDGVPIDDDSWTRRERVRELMAVLVHHQRIARSQVSLMLWPDAPPDKSSANLRTNLRHLQNSLEPNRQSGVPSVYLSADNAWLELCCSNIRVDAAQFERRIEEARLIETQGAPSVALREYQAALELYEGDYLTEFVGSEWAEFDRVRLRSLAAQASVRVAELLLARGEPEASAIAANRAVKLEALFERGHRARVRALLGQEDRAAARQAMQITLRTLADAHLKPEPDTTRLATSLGLV